MAVLAHALQIVGIWIAPLVIFLVKRQSRFVSFHALQALLFQGLYFLFSILLTLALFMSFIPEIFRQEAGHPSSPPVFFFVMFPLLWLFFMGAWLATLLLAILYSIKAGRWEWAEYPLLGRLARKILKIGPGGAVASSPSQA